MKGALLLLAALCAGASASAADAPAPALPAAKAAHNRLLDIAALKDGVVVAGQEGVILTSADGKAWQQRNVPVGTMLTRLRFVDDRHGWALGYEATVLETRDAGASWTLRHHDDKGAALYDVLFLDPARGIAVGAYGSWLESSDGGATWAARDNVLSGIGMHLNALLRLPGGALVAAGERGLVAVSADAGASWELLDSPYGGSWFGALPHGEDGLAVFGMRGNVFVADDLARCARMKAEDWDPYTRANLEDAAQIAARGWRRVANTRRDSVFGALAVDKERALLVGFNGAAQMLDLGAGTLTPLATPATETIVKAAVFRGRLLAVGRRGVQDLGEAP
ncbi:MAG TPA: YCF48-related protein [Candidatus Binatia bacterium]|nr:YCF48-related protein [Candidatus Binatia bacterium]